MSDTEGAATPTNEQPQAAAVEQATPAESIRDVDAPLENAEPKVEAEPAPDAAQEEAKRLSRSQRYQRKISAQAGVIDRIEAERQQLAKENEELKKAKTTDAAPNPADFPNGEWDSGYISKLAAHEALKAVRPELDARKQSDEQERQTNAAKTARQKLDDNAAKAREHIPDFDQTLDAFREDGGEFAPHVKEAIFASGDKAALIIYNLAKDPDHADRLNGMSPQEVLIEIGELRAKASLPERKTTTKAPAPLSTLRGGAAPSVDVHALAKNDDATAYIEARRKRA